MNHKIKTEIQSLSLEFENSKENEFLQQEIWSRLFDVLKRDELETIKYLLDEDSQDFIEFVSSVYDELFFCFKSKAFNFCLLDVYKKFPESPGAKYGVKLVGKGWKSKSKEGDNFDLVKRYLNQKKD